MFERAAGGGGWVTRALAPAASELATDSFYSLNAEAGTALFSAPGPPLGQDNFYASEDGALTDIGAVGERADDTNQVVEQGEHVATADLSHVVYRSISNILPLWGFDETSEQAGDLYEYARGYPGVLLVGVEGGRAAISWSAIVASNCRVRTRSKLMGRCLKMGVLSTS